MTNINNNLKNTIIFWISISQWSVQYCRINFASIFFLPWLNEKSCNSFTAETDLLNQRRWFCVRENMEFHLNVNAPSRSISYGSTRYERLPTLKGKSTYAEFESRSQHRKFSTSKSVRSYSCHRARSVAIATGHSLYSGTSHRTLGKSFVFHFGRSIGKHVREHSCSYSRNMTDSLIGSTWHAT